jgi:hypothetical protein
MLFFLPRDPTILIIMLRQTDKTMKYLLILSLVLIGCGPSEGDIYEDLLTEKRVTVSIGSVKCGESYDAAKARNEAKVEELKQMPPSKQATALLLNPFPIKGFDDDQGNGKCFVYTEMFTYSGVTAMMSHYISHDDIGQRWKKVN